MLLLKFMLGNQGFCLLKCKNFNFMILFTPTPKITPKRVQNHLFATTCYLTESSVFMHYAVIICSCNIWVTLWTKPSVPHVKLWRIAFRHHWPNCLCSAIGWRQTERRLPLLFYFSEHVQTDPRPASTMCTDMLVSARLTKCDLTVTFNMNTWSPCCGRLQWRKEYVTFT